MSVANDTTLTIQISKEALTRLLALSAQTGQTTSELVGAAIDEYLDVQDWHVAAIAEALAEADSGAPGIEHEKVVAWLNSWGSENELPPPV
jgi:predicted transcriptional regulator